MPLSELVQTLQATVEASDLAVESAIRNKLALYPFAIDTRTFSAFDSIFSEDARANYSYSLGVLEGRQAIKDKIQGSLTMFKGTQHTYGTQFIQIGKSIYSKPYQSFSYPKHHLVMLRYRNLTN